MKSIGFIDYYLEEWHAKSFPAWLDKCPANKSDYRVAYAWGEKKSPGGVTTEAWCEQYKVARCSSIEEVCEKSDVLVILSPDNAEKHLEYAEKVLPFRKPTYIDKTFAITLREAQKIFDLGKKSKTPLCSASSLRFAAEIKEYDGNAKSVVTIGAGPSYETYAVHQFEIITKVMGIGAEKLMVVHDGLTITIVVLYKNGRRAVYNQLINSGAPFTAGVVGKGAKKAEWKPITSDFYGSFTGALLNFFDTGKVMASKKETLSIIALIEAGRKGLEKPGKWIKVADPL